MEHMRPKAPRLTATWLLLQFIQLSYVVSAWIAARHLTYGNCGGEVLTFSPDSNVLEAFKLLWFSLIAIILSISGVYVMRRRRTPTALGFFVGVCVIMASWTLVLAVEAGDTVIRKKYVEDRENSTTFVEMKAFFAVLMFFLYGIFAIILMTWRDDILETSEQVTEPAYDEDDVCTKSGINNPAQQHQQYVANQVTQV